MALENDEPLEHTQTKYVVGSEHSITVKKRRNVCKTAGAKIQETLASHPLFECSPHETAGDIPVTDEDDYTQTRLTENLIGCAKVRLRADECGRLYDAEAIQVCHGSESDGSPRPICKRDMVKVPSVNNNLSKKQHSQGWQRHVCG